MSDTFSDQTDLSVQTVDSKGNAPKRRMATPSAAWSAYSNIRFQSVKRDARFAEIEGMFSGFPPTSPDTQARNGMPDMPNINTKQFPAKIWKYVSTWNAVSSQSNGWTEIQAKHEDSAEAMRRSQCLTEYFNDAIKTWVDTEEGEDFCSSAIYLLNSAARDTQMGLYGIGFSLFEDKIDFRFQMIPTRRVLVPFGTRLNLDNCPALFIEDKISVCDLWGMRDKTGWNSEAISRALYDRVELSQQASRRMWTYGEWVNMLRNNDTQLLYDFAPVQIVHVYCQEFDKTISHSVFCNLTYAASGPSKKAKSKNSSDKNYEDAAQSFLFDEAGVAKRWSQIGIAFADNAGPENDWHGVKGLGDMIFDGCDLNNILFSRAATGAFISNTLMFKGMSENDVQKMDQMVITNLGIMAPGLELEQQKFAGDINGAMEVFNVGTNILDQNSREFPQNQRTAGGEQPTATQVNADRADEAQFDSLQVETYRVFLDSLFSEMYRRIAQPSSKYPESWGGGKVAKTFRKRCADAGIPEADLLKVKRVKANRNGSSGNMSLDMLKAQQAMAVATPGKGQLNARKAMISAVWGHEMVPTFIQDEPLPTPDDQTIDMENLFLQEGQVPTAFGWQDHAKHVQSHLQLGEQASEAATQLTEQDAVQANLDGAEKLANLLISVATHIPQHVQFMQELRGAGGRPSLYEQIISDTLKQSHNLGEMGQSLLEEVQKAKAAQQPQVSPEMLKAQQDMQIKAAAAAQDMQIKKESSDQKLGNMAMQSHARTEMKLQQSSLQDQIKSQQATQDLQHKSVENVQSLVNTQVQHRQQMEMESENSTKTATE